MKYYLFIIETRGPDNSTIERAFTVRANSLEAACQRLHKTLYESEPEIWTFRWEDLHHDVLEGNQTYYGPFDEHYSDNKAVWRLL